MDPITAVSLTGSVVTIGALVLDCSQTLYNIGTKLKDAPEAVDRLSRRLQTFGELLKIFEARLNNHGSQSIPSDLSQACQRIVNQIGKDMKEFKEATSGLLKRLGDPSMSSKNIRLRFHALCKERAIEIHDKRMAGHHERLKIVLILINECVQVFGFVVLC